MIMVNKEGVQLENLEEKIAEWGESLLLFHLPRWEELPEIELYMDQVITLVDQYLSKIESSGHKTTLEEPQGQ